MGCSLDKGPPLNMLTSLSSAQEKMPVCLGRHLPEGPQLIRAENSGPMVWPLLLSGTLCQELSIFCVPAPLRTRNTRRS